MTSPLDRFSRVAARAANEVIVGYSTSFGTATRLLGPRHRQHVRNVYALVRVADELVDGVAGEAGLSPADQAAALDRLLAETHGAVATGYSPDVVVHAFARTARAAGIGADLIDPFFDSMRTDLERSREAGIAAFDAQDHAAYVYGSAAVVGLMCLRVFVRRERLGPERLARLEHGARQLGRAFQNVNFLRDLADDTGRLRRGYLGGATCLSRGERDAWVEEIRGQIAEAEAVLHLLPRDARAAVRSATWLFAELTDRIARVDPAELSRRRVRVSDARKVLIVARALARTAREAR